MLPESFLSLTRIFLHNWHRFQHDVLDVEDSLYLAGHNGSGKSSVLDALQVVLIADLVHVRFNSSAQDKSDRNLDTYVRGKLGEDYWLRPGNTIAYVALEFTDRRRQVAVTLGVCIEAGEGRTPDRTYFILRESLDVELFVPDGQPHKRADLRKVLRQRRGAKIHDNVSEYRDDVLDALGGLNPRFFELFLKALRFEPIRNIGDFVEQWLLDKKEVHLETLQSVRENLQALKSRAERVARQLRQLNDIVTCQQEVRRWFELHDQYLVLSTLLRLAAAQRHVEQLRGQSTAQQQTLEKASAELGTAQAALTGAEEAHRDAQRRYFESDVIRRRDELLAAIKRLTGEAADIARRWQQVSSSLQRETVTLQPLIATTHFTPAENDLLRGFTTSIDSLTPARAGTADWLAQIDRVLEALSAARQRATEAAVRLSDQITDLKQRGAALQREIAELEQQGKIRYRREVERLQDLLTPIVGSRPALLCEQIEITDARWQGAVEALLGQRRFNLIVPPEKFRAAVRELDRARAGEALYDVGLIDLAKAAAEARPAQPHSLATFVSAAAPGLRAYIDHVLGDIIACETVDELREYRRAVTPQVVVYGDWTVRAINPDKYTPHYIGQSARQSQIADRRRKLDAIGTQLAELVPQQQALDTAQRVLARYDEWIKLRERLAAPLDERSVRAQIQQQQAELDALDLS
ncbi:MAG: AAA family ATPase, partial [Chloroflexi bacterium]|nr:AAA family ATPase [Chloroflexota bacterium]